MERKNFTIIDNIEEDKASHDSKKLYWHTLFGDVVLIEYAFFDAGKISRLFCQKFEVSYRSYLIL